MRKDEDDGLLDELQEDIGADYSPHLRAAAGMLNSGGDPAAAVPYLLFSIAKSLEDMSYLLSNDSLSVIMDADEELCHHFPWSRPGRRAQAAGAVKQWEAWSTRIWAAPACR